MNAKSWVDHYYESLEFFYWEPQHLNRKRIDGSTKPFDVYKRLGSIEVTLNQIMVQFFSLSPKSVRNRVFEKALGYPVPGEFILSGSKLEKGWPKWSTCQPDFFFNSAHGSHTVSIEMKTSAKSDIGQVLKYILLAMAAEQGGGNGEMKHSLIFLGTASFSTLWKPGAGIKSVEEMRSALAREQSSFFDKCPTLIQALKPRFMEIASALEVGFLNYTELANLLNGERRTNAGSSAETYEELLTGLLKELKRRGLVSGTVLDAPEAATIAV
jgi:hypothetical protein